jgi:hypothetical protein
VVVGMRSGSRSFFSAIKTFLDELSSPEPYITRVDNLCGSRMRHAVSDSITPEGWLMRLPAVAGTPGDTMASAWSVTTGDRALACLLQDSFAHRGCVSLAAVATTPRVSGAAHVPSDKRDCHRDGLPQDDRGPGMTACTRSE